MSSLWLDWEMRPRNSARRFLHRSAQSNAPFVGDASHKTNIQAALLVLPVRIELTTSPLPRAGPFSLNRPQ
jgi:hypothetical protein